MKFSLLSNEEIQLFRVRLAMIGGVIVAVMAVLLLRIWFLQVIDGDYYEEVAKGNRIRVTPLEAPRGIIYDRRGTILAYNRPAFNIQLVPEDAPDLETSLQHLSLVTGHPYQELRQVMEENRSSFKFKPILLLEDIGRKSADLVDAYQEDLPGISVAVESKRLYPNAYITSHMIGYVGKINEEQLKALPLARARSGRIVGQAGIELMQNTMLIGLDGGKQVEVDHVGRELRVLGKPVNPVPGNDIYLTVDLRLQQFVKSLMIGQSGVVLVSRPRTGEILAMASFPDFDPNLFVGGIDPGVWANLTQGERKPLINKATQGLYAPGSTFKMAIAAAGLDLHLIDENTVFNCPGYYRVGRDIHYCWKRGGHGDITLRDALAQSCNVYFYQLGMLVGVDRIQEYARVLGFGAQTGVELESEKAGIVPGKEWKLRTMKERWYDGETLHLSIGQGFLTVTPIQLLGYVNALANRGMWVQPSVIGRVVSPDGTELVSPETLPRRTRMLPIATEALDLIRQGMQRAVNDAGGTARRAQSDRFVVAGKTGTSQVIGRHGRSKEDEDVEDKLFLPHSLFIAYAPANDPRVSVMVLVEHGRSGGEMAAPIARRIMEYYFDQVEPLTVARPGHQARAESGEDFRRALATAFPEDPAFALAAGPR